MDPLIGQIVMFAGNFAPRGWAFCDGQLLSIASNTALFSILGTTYGGDGRTTFGLPDLRGRFAMHPGQGPGLSTRKLGQKGGEESVTLTVNQIPQHNHNAGQVATSSTPDTGQPGNAYMASEAPDTYSAAGPGDLQMHTSPTSDEGGGQPHDNVPPFQCVNFIIALQGVYPSRN